MTRPPVAFALLLGLGVYQAVAGVAPPTETSNEEDAPAWEFSLSNSLYVIRNDREYVNPTFTADYRAIHLEARYNYEAIDSGSAWLGWNFSTGKKLAITLTPMIGGVFGDVAGVAPGYAISITYQRLEFFTQGEYFFDGRDREGNFFFTWSELSLAPVEWFRLGVVVDRTKILGASTEIRRGPLLGFAYRDVGFTTYWLSPGAHDSTFVFSMTFSF
jgi:hypothetical protein